MFHHCVFSIKLFFFFRLVRWWKFEVKMRTGARSHRWLKMTKRCEVAHHKPFFRCLFDRLPVNVQTVTSDVHHPIVRGKIYQIRAYYRKRFLYCAWVTFVSSRERERETPVTSSISRWNREWSCMWLPRQRVDPMHMHTRRRVLSLQLLSSARSAWQAKPQTATLATAQWPK